MQPPDFTSTPSEKASFNDMPIPEPEFWVFGYGSLMWNPGFDFIDRKRATINGFHRRLCLWSTRYRGSKTYPGLVLGLDEGGDCEGVAFLVDNNNKRQTAEYLFEREMTNNAYSPRILAMKLDNGATANCLTFISKTDHPQYVPKLDLQDIVTIVRRAEGPRGTNREYVINSAEHLAALGIHDPELNQVLKAL